MKKYFSQSVWLPQQMRWRQVVLRLSEFALRWGSFALRFDLFALRRGLFALRYGLFALRWGSFALRWGSFALHYGSFALCFGQFALQLLPLQAHYWQLPVARGHPQRTTPVFSLTVRHFLFRAGNDLANSAWETLLIDGSKAIGRI